MKYLYLDTETGGLDPSCALLTIGLVAHDDKLGILGTDHIKVSAEGLTVEPKAIEINKLNMPAHEAEAITRRAAADRVIKFIKHYFGGHFLDKPFVVGHNIAFDRTFMDKLFKDQGLAVPYSYRNLDTMGIALFLHDLGIFESAKSLKLDYLIERYSIEIASADRHTALGDALATRTAHLAMLAEVEAFYAFKFNTTSKEHSC